MSKRIEHQAAYFEGDARKLAYDLEFRELIRGRRGILKALINLAQEAEKEYSPDNLTIGDKVLAWNAERENWYVIQKDGKTLNVPRPFAEVITFTRGTILKPDRPKQGKMKNLEMVILGRSNRVWEHKGEIFRRDRGAYFKVTLEGQSFFVQKATETNNPGFAEFSNTIKAREALKGLGFVKTVQPQFGYHDHKQSWFVSKWEQLEEGGYAPYIWFSGSGLNDYGELVGNPFFLSRKRGGNSKVPEAIIQQELEMIRRAEEIKRTLLAAGMDINDLGDNLFYNWENKSFILLDVSVKSSERIGY